MSEVGEQTPPNSTTYYKAVVTKADTSKRTGQVHPWNRPESPEIGLMNTVN